MTLFRAIELLGGLLFVTLMLSSCLGVKTFQMVTVDATDNGKTVPLTVGAQLQIVLENDYEWEVEFSDKSLFRLVSQGPISGTGTEATVARLEVVKTGNVTLRATGEPKCLHTNNSCDQSPKTVEIHFDVR